MNTIHDKSIAIIGGGPGGLTLARLLQMNGADVKVYERDVNRSVRVQGATLDLHDESGLQALRIAGLMEAFKQNYRPGADQMKILDKTARIYLDESFANDKVADEFARPEIDRGPLRELLLNSLQPGTVIWDSQFQSLQPAPKRSANGDQQRAHQPQPQTHQPHSPANSNQPQTHQHPNDPAEPDNSAKPTPACLIQFANGKTATADIVIAADGANSKIRPYITPIKPFYSGVTAIEGSVYDAAVNSPETYKLTNGGKLFILGDEKSLIVSAKGDDSLSFYVGFKVHEEWTRECGIDWSIKAQVLNWYKSEFDGWAPIFTELFENAKAPFIPRPQYCMPFDQSWEAQPNLTLLGDAAHLMPPYAGEGVNMAMLDALELSGCLLNDKYPTTKDAIAAYETAMRKRASATAQMTMEQTDALHSSDSLKHILDMIGHGQ